MDTWAIWSHCAPADDIIVVSEIGEQWSPHTAPAIHAETQIIERGFPLSKGKTFKVMGISIPKVPQEVPVANARKKAMIKIIAGRKLKRDPALCSTREATYSAAPSESVMDFSVQASVRIVIAGTIALKPSEMQSIHERKFSTRLTM